MEFEKNKNHPPKNNYWGAATGMHITPDFSALRPAPQAPKKPASPQSSSAWASSTSQSFSAPPAAQSAAPAPKTEKEMQHSWAPSAPAKRPAPQPAPTNCEGEAQQTPRDFNAEYAAVPAPPAAVSKSEAAEMPAEPPASTARDFDAEFAAALGAGMQHIEQPPSESAGTAAYEEGDGASGEEPVYSADDYVSTPRDFGAEFAALFAETQGEAGGGQTPLPAALEEDDAVFCADDYVNIPRDFDAEFAAMLAGVQGEPAHGAGLFTGLKIQSAQQAGDKNLYQILSAKSEKDDDCGCGGKTKVQNAQRAGTAQTAKPETGVNRAKILGEGELLLPPSVLFDEAKFAREGAALAESESLRAQQDEEQYGERPAPEFIEGESSNEENADPLSGDSTYQELPEIVVEECDPLEGGYEYGEYPGYPLRFGSAGRAVYILQEYINGIANAVETLPHVHQNGEFDELTQDAVKALQAYCGLPVTGVVDRETWDEIYDLYYNVSGDDEFTPLPRANIRVLVYDNSANVMRTFSRALSDTMPYATAGTLSVKEFRSNSNSPTVWTTTRAMEAWNKTRRSYGSGIHVGYAFKRIWQGGHSATSQHWAGLAFDVGQNLTAARRRTLWNAAKNTGAWGYVEPQSLTPTWVHFDRRYGTPACGGTSGYPTLRSGSKGVYVLVLQDCLNVLGYSTRTLDGLYGANTQTAVRNYQRARGLTADGICGCATWRSITSRALNKGQTSTVLN